MRERTPAPRGAALALAGLVAAAGCVPTLAQGPARAPRVALPMRYGEGDEAGSAARRDWRELFDDPNLARLIDEALENNQELNIAVQEIIIANNEVTARRGEYLPSLGVRAGAGLDRVARDTSQGRSDEANGLSPLLQNYSAGLYASWEVDIWSRLHDLAGAADARYLATREGRNFLVTRLVAEIARRYYELLALDRQRATVEGNIALQASALQMVRLQQQAAAVTMLGVRRFEAQLQGFRANLIEVNQRIVNTENQLNLLLGRGPQPVPRRRDDFLQIEPPALRLGTPAELLQNRPDVRQAELELSAAALDLRAARARFYPALQLEGGLGYQSFDLRSLVSTPDATVFNLFAGLAAPLLNRRALTAAYASANARQMQSVLRYERAVVTAFTDVSTAVSLLRNLSQRYAFKTEQVARLAESVEVSTLLFNSSRADYLEVLTTRRDSLDAQRELIELKLQQLDATVTLYQALGGGWRARGDAPQQPNQASNAAPGVTP
ncbi:MAG: TolC family protein [Myxococcales bacterium]|nr:TolC family protein [Myxococcales bacterium]